MCDVFISYASHDEAFALDLRDHIEAAGLSAFVAKVSIEPGQRWTEEISRALKVAPWVLFVATRAAVRSAYVLQKIGAALVTDKTVVPITLDLPKSELPGWVDRIRALDLSGAAPDAMHTAVDALAGRIRADLEERALIGAAAATPRAAEALLAQLPLDQVPAPGPLPSGSRVRYPVNPLFVGREEEFRWLAGVLKAGGTAAVGQIAAATGYGGIGKTQLAAEFVHRYGRWFAGGVHWLSFTDPAGIASEVAACGGPEGMDLPGFEALEPAEQVERVTAEWRGAVPRLLVFDNCEDDALLALCRPPAGGARVLVTSRRSEWSAGLGVHIQRLGVLPRWQSVALLRKRRPDLPEEDPLLDAIADELGDLPFALHLAGHYLARYRHTPFGQPDACLESLRRKNLLAHPSMTRGDHSPTEHDQHVGRTFALSLARLDPKEPIDRLSLGLLARAAWLAPGEPIPRGLLLAAAGIDMGDEDSVLHGEDALRRLTDELGLLDADAGGGLRVHRLIAVFSHTEAPGAGEARDAIERLMLALENVFDRSLAREIRPLLPHARALAETATGERRGALLGTLGNLLQRLSGFPEAVAAYRAALEVYTRTELPQDWAMTQNNLGAQGAGHPHRRRGGSTAAGRGSAGFRRGAATLSGSWGGILRPGCRAESGRYPRGTCGPEAARRCPMIQPS